MSLSEVHVEFDEQQLGPEILDWLQHSRQRLTSFWDQFAQKPLAQYVECDFEFVAQALAACLEQELNDGKLFVEWGCGFGVVTGVASMLGLDAIGIEAEEFLCSEAQKLISTRGLPAEIWHGNFLPCGAAELADDADPIVSLSHAIDSAYDEHDLSLEDFAVVFAYPWPGEEHFLKLVFDRFARPSALLLLFRGPFHIEFYRKSHTRNARSG